MSASVFYQCAGVVTASGADLGCSTGWVMVSEPTFELLTPESVSGLLGAVLSLWAVWFLFVQISRALK